MALNLNQQMFSKFHTCDTFYDICLYHGGCPDGITGAYSFKQLYNDTDENKQIITIPIWPAITYNKINDVIRNQLSFINKINPADEVKEHLLDGLNVVCIDICPVKAIEEISKHCNSLLVLDHHKSNQEFIQTTFPDYLGNCFIEDWNKHIKFVFNMEESGASLAYKYCKDVYNIQKILQKHKKKQDDIIINLFETYYTHNEMPWYIEYVKDADLWNWKLANSKKIFTSLNTLDYFKFTKMKYLTEINTESKFNKFLNETLIPCADKAIELNNYVIDKAISKSTEVYCDVLIYENNIELNDNKYEQHKNKIILDNFGIIMTSSFINKTFYIKLYKRYNVILTQTNDYKIISELGNRLCDVSLKRSYPEKQEYLNVFCNNITDYINELKSYDNLSSDQKISIKAFELTLSNVKLNKTIQEEIINSVETFTVTKVKPDFSAIWIYNFVKDEIKVSLRSVGDFDVSNVAKCFNGGGHKNASGFILEGNKSQTLKDVFMINDNVVRLF